MSQDFIRPLGRRTIRRSGPTLATPMDTPPRANPHIRMWTVGDAKPGTTLNRLQNTYLKSLEAVDRIEARKAEAKKSGKFTPAGVDEDALGFAMSELVPVFKRGRDVIDAARREASTMREKIKLQPPDKSDIVGALQRREMRDMLRAMSDKERNQFISRNRENMDPTIALAIVELPAEFSGVMESDRKDLIDRALQAQHGQVMAELVELESAIEVAASAVEAGRNEVRLEVGADPRTFDEMASPIESKAGVPWLRKEGDRVVVVDLEQRIGRTPTPDELEKGSYFANFEEYQAANGSAA